MGMYPNTFTAVINSVPKSSICCKGEEPIFRVESPKGLNLVVSSLAGRLLD